jgi:1-acyl-sn-glycerol-3-phosphate acyltransferase
MNPWHSLLEAAAGLYTGVMIRGVRAAGRTHIPAGPKIVIANHPDASAIFALPQLFTDRLCFLAQADLFDLPVIGSLLRRAGHVPVVRGQWPQLLAAATERLAQGYSIALCPEGRISPRGGLARPHTGAVRLALATGAAIVPVGCYVPPEHLVTVRLRLGGQPRMGRWQFGGHCYLHAGPAWRPPSGTAGTIGEAQQFTEQVWARVVGLVEQARLAAAAERRPRLRALPSTADG